MLIVQCSNANIGLLHTHAFNSMHVYIPKCIHIHIRIYPPTYRHVYIHINLCVCVSALFNQILCNLMFYFYFWTIFGCFVLIFSLVFVLAHPSVVRRRWILLLQQSASADNSYTPIYTNVCVNMTVNFPTNFHIRGYGAGDTNNVRGKLKSNKSTPCVYCTCICVWLYDCVSACVRSYVCFSEWTFMGQQAILPPPPNALFAQK